MSKLNEESMNVEDLFFSDTSSEEEYVIYTEIPCLTDDCGKCYTCRNKKDREVKLPKLSKQNKAYIKEMNAEHKRIRENMKPMARATRIALQVIDQSMDEDEAKGTDIEFEDLIRNNFARMVKIKKRIAGIEKDRKILTFRGQIIEKFIDSKCYPNDQKEREMWRLLCDHEYKWVNSAFTNPFMVKIWKQYQKEYQW